MFDASFADYSNNANSIPLAFFSYQWLLLFAFCQKEEREGEKGREKGKRRE